MAGTSSATNVVDGLPSVQTAVIVSVVVLVSQSVIAEDDLPPLFSCTYRKKEGRGLFYGFTFL